MEAVVYRPRHGRLEVRTPWESQPQMGWRRVFTDAGLRPRWERPRRCWTLNRARLPEVLDLLGHYFPEVQVILDGSETEKCDTRCQQAKGPECVCSCAGTHHGTFQTDSWRLVGDTTLVRSGLVRARFTWRPDGH